MLSDSTDMEAARDAAKCLPTLSDFAFVHYVRATERDRPWWRDYVAWGSAVRQEIDLRLILKTQYAEPVIKPSAENE